jgi:Fic family protein
MHKTGKYLAHRFDNKWCISPEQVDGLNLYTVASGLIACAPRYFINESIDADKYLKEIDDLFVTDAYHSLSIEGYKVTAELIERIREGGWSPENIAQDREQRNSMAACGYWQAFQSVKSCVEKVIEGENAGKVADEAHGDWYRELFAPSVTAGIIKASDLAGYRSNQVWIQNSKYVPPRSEEVRDMMPAFFELLKKEESASVRVVLGHFIFVYIHPYMDGNGRMARFLMNVMLASGGYPWTVLPVEERNEYMQSLEEASTSNNISRFAKFIAHHVEEGMKGKPVAKIQSK